MPIGFLKGKGPSGFGYRSTAEQVTEGLNLAGKTYLVTGSNSGLGTEAVRVLGLRGARVLATARSEDKALEACKGFSGEIIPIALDLSEPASVRAAVAKVKDLGHSIDGIIANAGIMALPTRELKHGYEMQFFTNHIGNFILVTGLLDRLAADGRVVALSSAAHKGTYSEGVRLDDLSAEKGYNNWQAYGQSKLCNLLFARHLAKRLPKGQTAYSVHPGVINTNLGRHMNRVFQGILNTVSPLVLKSIPQGAATEVYVATHPAAAAQGQGLYWADCNVETPSKHGQNDALAAALWDKSEEIVAGLP